MSYYIHATIPVTTEDPISIIGTDDTFVELHVRRLGELLELRAIAIECNAFTGQYLCSEIGVETAEDNDDAINAAEDLQYAANEFLDERHARGYSTPCGFGEAVEYFLDARHEDAPEVLERAGVIFHPIAAE
jgi:hypothetical protein